MSNMIECGTCGYPLLPEERRSLVESNGKMVKPWVGLTHNERIELSHDYRNYDDARGDWFDRDGFARAIEAKLKEKNT